MPPSDEPIAIEGPAQPDNGQKRAVRAGAPVKAGAPVAALVPRTIEEAWRLATAMSRSGLAPRDMRRPEQVLVAIMAGAEVGLPPFMAVQSIAIINGRPVMWGDGLIGVVRARGVKVTEWMDGEGDERVARCTVKRADTGEEITREFSVEDAKIAKLWNKRGNDGQDTPWVTYPRRMLQMRARSWAIRDGCADLTRGIRMREEVLDEEAEVLDITVPTVGQFLQADIAEGGDGDEIEIIDAVIEEPATAQASDATPSAEAATSEPEEVDVRAQRSGLKDPSQNTPDGNQ